jgi:hypothetical protein
MIVWKNGDYTRIALHAQHIADAANIAYWTRDKQPTVTVMKEDDIAEDFKAMAKLLGFQLKRVEE